jgi:hypothetical protein
MLRGFRFALCRQISSETDMIEPSDRFMLSDRRTMNPIGTRS